METDQTTPFFLAAQAGHASTMQVLAGFGADVDCQRSDGCTPAWMAAANGDAATIETLAALKADMNLANNNGLSPVWIAVSTQPRLSPASDASDATNSARFTGLKLPTTTTTFVAAACSVCARVRVHMP